MKFLKNKDVLSYFARKEQNRYIQNKKDGEDYLLMESLNHYVVKKLKTEPSFEKTI